MFNNNSISGKILPMKRIYKEEKQKLMMQINYKTISYKYVKVTQTTIDCYTLTK